MRCMRCSRVWASAAALIAIAGAAGAGESPAPVPDKSGEIPRFAVNSPFSGGETSAATKPEKRLWATSFLWSKAPPLEVEKWLTQEPKTDGKFVLLEFWATWCGPCRRTVPLLNTLHAKYANDLVVIGISDEKEEAVRTLSERHPGTPAMQYYVGIDTQARTKKALGVFGIPHVVILEPEDRCVIWEGFPLQKGYELTEQVVERILAAGRKRQAAKSASE